MLVVTIVASIAVIQVTAQHKLIVPKGSDRTGRKGNRARRGSRGGKRSEQAVQCVGVSSNVGSEPEGSLTV